MTMNNLIKEIATSVLDKISLTLLQLTCSKVLAIFQK